MQVSFLGDSNAMQGELQILDAARRRCAHRGADARGIVRKRTSPRLATATPSLAETAVAAAISGCERAPLLRRTYVAEPQQVVQRLPAAVRREHFRFLPVAATRQSAGSARHLGAADRASRAGRCLAQSQPNAWPPFSIALVDAGGTLVLLRRQDGASAVTVDAALLKARTAARAGAPTQARAGWRVIVPACRLSRMR